MDVGVSVASVFVKNTLTRTGIRILPLLLLSHELFESGYFRLLPVKPTPSEYPYMIIDIL